MRMKSDPEIGKDRKSIIGLQETSGRDYRSYVQCIHGSCLHVFTISYMRLQASDEALGSNGQVLESVASLVTVECYPDQALTV